MTDAIFDLVGNRFVAHGDSLTARTPPHQLNPNARRIGSIDRFPLLTGLDTADLGDKAQIFDHAHIFVKRCIFNY